MITSIIIFAMTFYFGLLVLLYVLQDRLVFPAPKSAFGEMPTGVKPVEIETASGYKLVSYLLENDQARANVIFVAKN